MFSIRIHTLLIAIGTALILSGCDQNYFIKSAEPPPSGYSVDEVPFRIQLGFLPGQVALADSQQADLALFLAQAEPADRVVIAASGVFALDRQTSAATPVFDAGLTDVSFAVGGVGENIAEVTLYRRTVLPMACSVGRLDREAGGTQALPLGCANQITMMQQVRNQRDLFAPAPMSAPNGEAAAAAYRVWLLEREGLAEEEEVDDAFIAGETQ